MAKNLKIYQCEVCGNIVEVLHGGKGELVGCGQPMKRFKENTTDAAKEKHVHVLEKTHDRYKVMAGEVAHPMEKKDYSEWLELIIARMERLIGNSCGPGSNRKGYST